MHLPSAAFHGTGPDLASAGSHPLLHPGQPAAATGLFQPGQQPSRGPVDHADLHLWARAGDDDVDRCTWRVLERVGQALLDHPIGGIGDVIRKALGGAVEPAADGEPGCARLGDELADQPDAVDAARLRVMIQQVDQATYLSLGLPGSLPDGVERLGRQGRISRGEPLAWRSLGSPSH